MKKSAAITRLTPDDQATIFVLAGLALEVAVFTATGELQKAAKLMGRIGEVVNHDKKFLPRFRQVQRQVLEETSSRAME